MAPNPASENLTITFRQANAGKVNARITDISGITIYNNVIGNAVSGSAKLNLTQFSAGIYMVEVSCNGQKIVQKLVKE